VLRILGRLSAAEAAYEAAVGQGHEPQPGLALLRLAQGRTDAAEASVRRLLAEPRGHVQRCLLLPAAVEVTLAVGHPTEARVFADELSATAEEFGCSGLQAMATQALGAVLLTEKDPASALAVLRTALGIWRIIDAPYDAARCRVLIGQALSDLGDDDSAAQELAEAHATFVRIGAKPDAHRLIPEPARRLPGGLTEREVEVLRLVATGKSNPQIATALVLSEKTVARHLSNIFGKLDVSSRTAAAAYAFEHRLL
jgi:DNA-binding NarL/FixJ family response regulator